MRTAFLEHLLSTYFKVACPQSRLIQRDDESSAKEHTSLLQAVRRLVTTLDPDAWQTSEVRPALESPYLMVLQLVRGTTLCHRSYSDPPQRPLSEQDYIKMGRLFLFDLLIRNTDRFPSRKVFPRPGRCSIRDAGNPGNLMFGPDKGSVYYIDKVGKIFCCGPASCLRNSELYPAIVCCPLVAC